MEQGIFSFLFAREVYDELTEAKQKDREQCPALLFPGNTDEDAVIAFRYNDFLEASHSKIRNVRFTTEIVNEPEE